MSVARVRLHHFFLVACSTLFAATFAAAQDPPPNFETGLKPYGSFHGGDVDTVSLSQGGLSVHVPLLSYPQRGGKLKLDFGIYYNNYDFGYTPHCPHNGDPCSDTLYTHNIRQICVSEAQTVSIDSSPKCRIPPPVGLIVANPTLVTSDGSHHPFGDTGLGWSATIDGTGFRTNASGNWVDQAGVIYGNGFREDPNGNKITWGSGGWTDSLNRTIPPGSNSTDTSGCVGPLPVASVSVWNVPGPSGATVPYKFCSVNVLVNFSVPAPDNPVQMNQTWVLIQSILLPNGQSWEFEYNDTYGGLTKITFPTGGTIAYTWGTVQTDDTTWTRRVLTRTVDSMDGTGPHTWTYTYGGTPYLGPFPFTNTVTDPLGNYVNHVFSNLYAGSILETQTTTYDKSSGTPVLLKTVNTDYQWTTPLSATTACLKSAVNILPIRVTTIWPNGKQTKVESDYDMSFTFKDLNPNVTQMTQGSYGKVLTKREYDYGSGAPGALLRTTATAYLALTNSNYLTIDGVGLPTSVTIYDGGGTQRAKTTYGYDATPLVSSGITTQHDSAPPNGTYRGNQTSVSRWLNTTGGNVTRNATFYDTGTPYQVTDPGGHTTSYFYSSTFAGAYPTMITNALTQSTNYNYDFNTGLRTSSTDANNKTTNYSYDNMSRISQVSFPDGGLQTITHQETTFPFSATLTKKINFSQNFVNTNFFDGLGRVTQTQLTSDPDGTTFTATAYDPLGRIYQQYNPTRCNPPTTSCGESSWGYTTYVYDALSRTCVVVPTDGTAVTGNACPSSRPANDVFTAYSGNATTVTDQAGKSRKSVTDGLGRLTQVFEDPSALNYETDYTYDALGNLLTVNQKGGTTNSANWRARTFTYDSLSRLTSSINPESNTVTSSGATLATTYAYDPIGNLSTKNAPAQNQTGTTTVTLSYCYDALNRLTAKAYSAQSCPMSSPVATYLYDQTAYNGLTITNGIGRRTGMTDAAGTEAWSYDALGRVLFDQRATNAITKTASYVYLPYVDGSVNTITYPGGRTLTYATNSAERLLSVQDNSTSVYYAAGAHYAPPGALAALTNGTGLFSTFISNSRLQPCWVYTTTGTALPWSTTGCSSTATTGSILDFKYNFNNGVSDNGNVAGITNNRDATRSQSFTYDALNRISSAQTQTTGVTIPNPNCWGLTFGYDPWGNLLQSSITGPAGCGEPIPLNVTATTANRISGYCYDSSGNLLDKPPAL